MSKFLELLIFTVMFLFIGIKFGSLTSLNQSLFAPTILNDNVDAAFNSSLILVASTPHS